MESRVDRAEANFREGYNCAQSVFLAYADIAGIDRATALKKIKSRCTTRRRKWQQNLRNAREALSAGKY